MSKTYDIEARFDANIEKAERRAAKLILEEQHRLARAYLKKDPKASISEVCIATGASRHIVRQEMSEMWRGITEIRDAYTADQLLKIAYKLIQGMLNGPVPDMEKLDAWKQSYAEWLEKEDKVKK